MKLKQIAIFIENSPGRIAEVCGVLGDAGINIRALSLGDSADFGVLRLVTNNPERTITVLKEKGFTVVETNVVGVEIPDKPGGLASVLKILAQNDINVEYMYVLVTRAEQNAYVIFRFTNNDMAIQVLTREGVRILKGEEIYNI